MSTNDTPDQITVQVDLGPRTVEAKLRELAHAAKTADILDDWDQPQVWMGLADFNGPDVDPELFDRVIAAYIAAVNPTAVLGLLAEIDSLRVQVEGLKTVLAQRASNIGPLYEVSDEERSIADDLAAKFSAAGMTCDGDDVLLSRNISLMMERFLTERANLGAEKMATAVTKALASGTTSRDMAARILLAQMIRRLHMTGTVDEMAIDVSATLLALLGDYTQSKKLKHPGG